MGTVGVDRRRLDAFAFQADCQPVGNVFHANENEHDVELRVRQQMHEQFSLQMLRHFVNELRHGLGGIGAAPDLDDFGRMLKLACHLFDLAGERGREQHGLAFHRHHFHNAADVRQEPHVEHPVGFVQHEKLQSCKIPKPAAHQIQQPPGRGDDDVHTGMQRLNLRAFADAAINRRHAQGEMPAVGADILFDLDDQLPGRRQDQHADTAFLPGVDHAGQFAQNRQREGRRLAGAGLRNPDQILSRKNQRDSCRLNRSRFCVTGFGDGFQYICIKTECAKWHSSEL